MILSDDRDNAIITRPLHNGQVVWSVDESIERVKAVTRPAEGAVVIIIERDIMGYHRWRAVHPITRDSLWCQQEPAYKSEAYCEVSVQELYGDRILHIEHPGKVRG